VGPVQGAVGILLIYLADDNSLTNIMNPTSRRTGRRRKGQRCNWCALGPAATRLCCCADLSGESPSVGEPPGTQRAGFRSDGRWRHRLLAAMVSRMPLPCLERNLVWFLGATSSRWQDMGGGTFCFGAGRDGGGPGGRRRRDGLGAEPAGRQTGASRSRDGALKPATGPGRPSPAASLRHPPSAAGRRQPRDRTSGQHRRADSHLPGMLNSGRAADGRGGGDRAYTSASADAISLRLATARSIALAR
jgi:hypothetical protein